MRRLTLILAATSLLVAACSRPDDNGVVIIDDVVVLHEDVGNDAGEETPLLEGEFVVAFEVDELRIYDAGEFLFVIEDGARFSWLLKSDATPIDFGIWPDPTRPDDGPPSLDVAWDDTYLYFLTESESGDWVLVGVEHFLGNASPLFGQPIIIIDPGPLQNPRGLERFGERFVIPVGGAMPELITVGENFPPMRVPLPGEPIFDLVDRGYLWLTDADQVALTRYDAGSNTVATVATADAAPRVFAATDDGVYALVGDELAFVDTSGATSIVNDAKPSATPQIAAHGDVVAWTSEGELRVYDGSVKRYAAGAVDAIVVDETHVFWSGPTGIYRAPRD